MEGIFVLFQDTGLLAPNKARALVNRCKKNIISLEKKFTNWKVLAIPVLPSQGTELRALKLTKKGVIVFYIDVGSRSPQAAEAFIEDIKDQHPWLEDLGDKIAKVFIPLRGSNNSNYETDVEYLDMGADDEEKTERT